MSKITKYNIFIFFSSLSRSILELYSSIMLYKMGYNIKNIYLFFMCLCFFSIFINFFTMYLGNKINYNILLIFSSIAYILCFYYFSYMKTTISNLLIFSILLAISYSMYNIIRHYFALKSIDKNYIKNISLILIFNYIAVLISSYVSSFINNNIILVILVFISSILGIIPLFSYKEEDKSKITYNFNKIDKDKIKFFIFEQSKVIFLYLAPLYLYLNLNKNLKFIGIFNIIISVISIIFIYFFSKKVKLKYFYIFNIIFCIILILKINIINKNILIPLVLFEGIGIKIFELFSHNNLYNINNIDKKGYILIVESIFNIIKFLMFFIFYIFNLNLKLVLYICIFEIFICSFIKRKKYS